MRELFLFLFGVGSSEVQWFPILPQFNAGRIYMQKSTEWSDSVPGPVCRGMRKYAQKKEFADWVCQQNGFQSSQFYGTKNKFISRMKTRY